MIETVENQDDGSLVGDGWTQLVMTSIYPCLSVRTWKLMSSLRSWNLDLER